MTATAPGQPGASDEAEAVRLTQALVSRRCGLVREMAPQGRGTEEPCPPYLWTATLSHFDFRAAGRSERLNAGKGRTEAEARLSALGEAIERYCAYHWDAARIRVGRASAGSITPDDLVLHSQAQHASGTLPYPPWSDETDTSWISGTELPGGTPVDLPAALVFLVSPTPRHDDHVTAITSNGLAAGADLECAIIGGLHEVIERDALMITWLNRLPATLIETPETGCMAAAIIRHYRRHGVQVRLFRLASDQAPVVVMAVADNPDPAQGVRMIGMGCDLDGVAAIDKAMFELCQARPSMASRMAQGDAAGRLRSYADVRDLDDHPLFHALPGNSAEFDFLLASGQRTTIDGMPRHRHATPADTLARIVAAASDAGARVAYCDITAPDIAPLGPRVVRCVITGFQPIHFGHGEGRLGGARLFEAPVRWGLRDVPLTEAELNPCPHPLA
ncbi:YcaO-like family protein [Paracoccus salsus]|uniref:YcaO-like family protein n=1 Tax=Paracoccus salsus TaxID=2911061 RepID=UPI001F391A62|nr:YcaO-like family protein [Paracoccus salsus]MCF3974290.1 YcaO-like family protein [Paracoccus salsus]